MEFLGSIFENVFRPLKDLFAKTYGYVASSHYYINALEDEMNELNSKRDDVSRMVAAAERQGLEATSQVKWWLESVVKLEQEVGLIKAEYEARLRLPVDQTASMRIRYLLSKKADKTTEEVRNLKERTFAKFADELVLVRFEEIPTVPVVRMGPMLEKLKASLEDNDIGIIGIFGMAGVGKTALLRKFNNEYLGGAEGIDVAIYIEVTHDYDLNEIQTIIGDRLGLSWEKKGPKERAVVLYKVLSKMNFVIILDDLWEPIDLQMLGIPAPKQKSKSKIILSTRIEDVCDRMDVRRKIKFDCLPWEHAWELFQKKVSNALAHPNPEIHRLAEIVAMKCGGLPLALITVGRALASKRTTKEWKQAITVLKIALWQLLGMENDLLVPLKHSYDNLPNDKLRLCLLHCSLFPEDVSIFKEWIIGYCIGEGFIDDLYTEMDEIYNKGHDLLGELKTASLLESEDEEHIKMHPMIRAMALWIASDYGTKETKSLVRFKEMPTVPVVGMNPILEQLKTSLEDSEIGIIGIFGMAGVGKTGLLKKFNNEYLVGAEGINVAIYIEVTHDYNLNKIQKIIGDRLGLSWDEKGPTERAVVLYEVHSKMNFVIILDDIWEPINLRMLGIPVPKEQSKSKIFLSTRIEDVCYRMNVKRKVKFDCLPLEHAWELFQEKVGDALAHPNPEIHRLAEIVAMKCGGLPLALITVGHALASKRTTKEWKHAITVLKIAPWQLLGMENDLLVPLKHSYDNLPNDKLRLCLLYCSLFPEDFSIFKEWIIGYCIGEGFIGDLYTEMDEIYNEGHDLLGDLKTASLLESEDEEHIKMHPMVRAMALWIASDYGTKETKWLVCAGIGLKDALGAEKWSEAERISFMRNNIFELYEQPKCPSLKSLMLQSNPALEKICDGFFQYMPTLRVLDLSHTSISELPSGLSALGQLQYLDLYNTNIKVLPSELGELVNLRFLLLSHTPLETIPNGVLCCLTLLQVLYMDLTYGDWKVGTSGSGVEFQELESLRRLKAFDATIKILATLQRLAQSPRLAGSTRNLLIKAAAGLKSLKLPSSDLWKNMTKLKRVWAWGCADLEEVVINGSDVNHNNDPNLESNVVCRGYNIFPDEEKLVLPNLESIILQQLQKAKIIYKGGCLQQLTSLFTWYCPGLERLITCANDEGEQPLVIVEPFPKLKELYLHGLMQLKSFSTERYLLSFPSLENLKVIECPQLKKLELSAKDLMEIHGENEWWNALEWENDMEVKERFKPLFKPLR